MEHTARSTIRKAKDLAKGYSSAEAEVREATSNDPWGAPASLLEEIALSTYIHSQAKHIMDMVWKRMNDSYGKNWRHVIKSLTLLDYLIKNGHERCLDYASERIHDIRTLKEFQYIDEDGKDQGVHIRQKSKDLVALIQDPERIKEERERSKQLKDRLGQSNTSYSSNNNSVDFPAAPFSSKTPPSSRDSVSIPVDSYEAAIKAQRESYYSRGHSASFSSSSSYTPAGSNAYPVAPRRAVPMVVPRGVQREDNDADLQRAIEESKRTHQEELLRKQRSEEAIRQAKLNILPYKSTPNDPFSSSDPFQPSPVKSHPDVFGQSFAPKSDPFKDAFEPTSKSSFNSAFDGGNLPKPLPYQNVPQEDPNSRLASIARNSAAIDPFAEMATSRARSVSLNQRPQSTYVSSSTSSNQSFGSSNTGYPLPPPPLVTSTSTTKIPPPITSATLPPPITSSNSFDILAPVPISTVNANKQPEPAKGVININLDEIQARQLYGQPARQHNWGMEEGRSTKSLNELKTNNPFTVF